MTKITDMKLVSLNPAKINVETGMNAINRNFDVADAVDAELVASILHRGIVTPLEVRKSAVDGKVYVVAGHRRLAALLHINTKVRKDKPIVAVPCIMVPDNSLADRTADIIHSNTSKPLTPLALGGIFMRLKSYGDDDKTICNRYGYGLKYVRDLLKLARQDDEVKAWIEAGKVAAATVTEIMAQNGEEVGKALIGEAIKTDGKATNKTLAKAASKVKGAKERTRGLKTTPAATPAATPGKPIVTGSNPPGGVRKPVVEDSHVKADALHGPYTRMGDAVCDGTGAGIGAMDSPALAQMVVETLNAAWSASKAAANRPVRRVQPANPAARH